MTPSSACGRGLHQVEVLALLGRQLGVQRQFRHPDDAVHRRPDLVAHVGQELALRAVGRLGRVQGALGRLDGPLGFGPGLLGRALRLPALGHLLPERSGPLVHLPRQLRLAPLEPPYAQPQQAAPNRHQDQPGEREEPGSLVQPRRQVEVQGRGVGAPASAAVTRHDLEPIAAGRHVGVERRTTIPGLHPVGIDSGQSISELDVPGRQGTEPCIVNLDLAAPAGRCRLAACLQVAIVDAEPLDHDAGHADVRLEARRIDDHHAAHRRKPQAPVPAGPGGGTGAPVALAAAHPLGFTKGLDLQANPRARRHLAQIRTGNTRQTVVGGEPEVAAPILENREDRVGVQPVAHRHGACAPAVPANQAAALGSKPHGPVGVLVDREDRRLTDGPERRRLDQATRLQHRGTAVGTEPVAATTIPDDHAHPVVGQPVPRVVALESAVGQVERPALRGSDPEIGAVPGQQRADRTDRTTTRQQHLRDPAVPDQVESRIAADPDRPPAVAADGGDVGVGQPGRPRVRGKPRARETDHAATLGCDPGRPAGLFPHRPGRTWRQALRGSQVLEQSVPEAGKSRPPGADPQRPLAVLEQAPHPFVWQRGDLRIELEPSAAEASQSPA